MFKFCNLFSGSTGNSSLVITDNTKILIDAGESAKKIVDALFNFNISITDIDGIVVTHEHSDHTKAIPILSKRYNVPIYANVETFNAMESLYNKEIFNKNFFIPYKNFKIKDLDFFAFNVPHDAANPCAFNIFYKENKISVATDLGHINTDIMQYLKNSSFILLESNYDSNILKCSKYPYYLKERISGPLGHLSNETSGKVVSSLMHYGLNHVELAHLSKENNFPELAYKTVVDTLIENNYDENTIKIDIASNRFDRKMIDIA